jgi:hypothetical protein
MLSSPLFENARHAPTPRRMESGSAAALADRSPPAIAQRRREALLGAPSLQHQATQLRREAPVAGPSVQIRLGGRSAQGEPEGMPFQLRKDAAVWSDGNKTGGMTPLKLVKRKDTNAIERYRFKYDGNRIDSFAVNQAQPDDGKGTKLSDGSDVSSYPIGSGYIVKDNVNLKGALSKEDIEGGDRNVHFAKANQISGVTDDDKTTWHHMGEEGKLQLVDMNVHGDFWHYGGIAHWGETKAQDDGASE